MLSKSGSWPPLAFVFASAPPVSPVWQLLFAMLGLLDVFVIVLVTFLIGTIYWYATIPKNLPPGPLGLPLIGSLWHFRHTYDHDVVVLGLVKKYGPLVSFYIGNKLFIILGDYETIQEALIKQGDVFTGRHAVKALMPEKMIDHGLVTSEGELWKEQRRFALSTLRDFGIGRPIIEPKIKEEIDRLSERISEYARTGIPFDPQPHLLCTLANIISQLVFGRRFDYDGEEGRQFMRQFIQASDMVSKIGFFNPVLFSEGLASIVKLFMPKNIRDEMIVNVAFNDSQIDKTAKDFDPESPPTNYIHAFLKAGQDHPGGTFDDRQLFASVSDLFAAGTETSSTTIRYGILLLAIHPEIQERMYNEIREQVGTNSLPDYADRMKLPFAEAVVYETQRYTNLVPFGAMRRAVQPTKLLGYDIPQDAMVLSFLHNVLFNPDVFPEPEKFNPSRFLDSNGKVIRDPKLIPFMMGKRVCLGEPLARMELFLIMVGLISRFRFYFTDDQKKPPLKAIVGLMNYPHKYEVHVEARND